MKDIKQRIICHAQQSGLENLNGVMGTDFDTPNQVICIVHKGQIGKDIQQYWWINSSSPGKNGRRFADDIFNCIFMNEKFSILTRISLNFVPMGPSDYNPALV